MLFNSATFIFLFLPLTLQAFFATARFSRRAATAVLALASLIFYGIWKPIFLPLLVASIILNFLIGERILTARRDSAGDHRARTWMILGVSANLLALGWWKYAGLLGATLHDAIGWPHHLRAIALPLGISFFTFTQIAYLVDARRGLVPDKRVPDKRVPDERAPDQVAGAAADPHLLADLRQWLDRFTSYALFVSYFPHLIAGPILHHSEMMPQFADRRVYRFSWDNAAIGVTLFGIGLCKKIIFADSLAPHVNAGFAQIAAGAPLGLVPGWLTLIAFSLQIYFDFSGYSDMAIGLSRLFGVHLPLNFNSPYRASNIIDFWRRWHMTLSRFLRDYLYFPLGGNRQGDSRRYVNLMIVMLLGGLWHGAAWTFALWGGLHGLFLVVNHLWQKMRGPAAHPASALVHFASQLVTYLLVVIAWVPFRAPDLATSLKVYGDLIGIHGWGQASDDLLNLAILAAPLLLIAWFAPNSQQIMGRYLTPQAGKGPGIARQVTEHWWQWRPQPAYGLACSGVLAGVLYLVVFTHRVSPFLYFQF
jgi:D-alanyl-lipoteichoic acid acyltransferase DltB (MBOAT superfamily)